MWAKRSVGEAVVHLSTGARRRADLSGVLGVMGRLEGSVLVVAADASGALKDGVGAVGINVDLDPRLDEMGVQRAFRDLQLQRPVGEAIVVADLALLFDARDLVQIDARDGRARRARLGRRHGEAGVVRGQIDVAEESVSRLDRGNSGELEFLDQTVLKGLEGSLGARARLGRSGEGLSCDGPTWVGWPRSTAPPFSGVWK